MIKAHKIRLDPNNKQKTLLSKSCGVARFAYNWALAEWKEEYKKYQEDNSNEKPNQLALRRKLNQIKRDEFPLYARSFKVLRARSDN
jgi:putative transposase